MKKKPGRVPDGMFWSRTIAAAAVLSIGLVAVMFLFSGKSSQASQDVRAAAGELKSGEKAATIQVKEGSGWLSTGEEIQIAEWYTGSDRKEGEYFAKFRGSDGGATVDLRLAGLNRSGTFKCADLSVELRVDVENTYHSQQSESTCEVTVTRLNAEVMEGHYTATLVNAGDADDDVTITGRFRATRPHAERLSAAAGVRVARL